MCSFLLQCLVTLVLLLSPNIESLIVYVTAVEAMFTLSSVSGLLWMRYKRPKDSRPIKVNLALPLTFLVICTFLVLFSCFINPVEVGIGIAFIAFGVPVYCVFIKWQNKPKWMLNICNSFNLFCSKMFLSLPEDSKDLWSHTIPIITIFFD